MSADSELTICVLYPELLGTYGDGGNATVLAKRLEWRGIEARVLGVNTGEDVPDGCDIYLMGGGEDQPQTSVTDHLMASRALHRAAAKGAVVLAVCAGMQVLGESFAVAGGTSRPGLGILDITTVRGHGPRRVGEIAVRPHPDFGTEALTGYENHGGVTRLGASAKPLGTVITGWGNDDGEGSEGAVQGKVLATYLHGPVLARNSQLADLLLGWAVGSPLDPIDDEEVSALREERLSAAKTRSVSTLARRLKATLRLGAPTPT